MISGGVLMRLASDNAGTWGFWQPLMSGPYLTDIEVASSADYGSAINNCSPGYSPMGVVASTVGIDPPTCTTGETVRLGALPTNAVGNLNMGTPKGKYIIACMIRVTR
ncbi:MAG: hypothetical protein JWM41_2845 [Gemmatimonadetes bacterium]|nr:hypothetical protein [Gemmatimonadota bacterium]